MKLHSDALSLETILGSACRSAVEFLHGVARRPAALTPKPLPPDFLPPCGEGALAALTMFRNKYEAQLSGSAGPRFLGYVIGGSTPAALAADWLVSAYDQNAAFAVDSVVAAVEEQAIAMLRELFHLPPAFGGVFVTGTTQANLVCLATARQALLQRAGHDAAEDGLWSAPRIRILSATPHISVLKALSILGMGRRSVEYVPQQPGRHAMDTAALEQMLQQHPDQPTIVVGSAGEVDTGDFDDFVVLRQLCSRYGAWLHVDGAFGLFAACDPDRAHLVKGVEGADTIAVDAHKWLNVPYDAGVVFNRHVDVQRQVFRSQAAYLGAGPDPMHLTPETSRRFRALPAWMTLVAYGRDGYEEMIKRCCSLALDLGRAIDQSEAFELLAPVRLNIVCFALRAGSEVERDRFLQVLKADGRVLLTPAWVAGRPAIRAAFSNWSTTADDVVVILDAMQTALRPDLIGAG